MNIWSEMMTALRGGMDELGEAMQTSQAIEILERQIQKIDMILQESKQNLAASLVKQKQAETQINLLQTEIIKYEDYAIKALEQNNETLALEVAEQIARLENELAEQQHLLSKSQADCKVHRKTIRQTEQNILRAKQQLDTVKASSSVNKAQESVSVKQEGSQIKPLTAIDVLERIKKNKTKQAQATTKDDLCVKLMNAGIIKNPEDASADAVLAKIKQKEQKGTGDK